MGKKIDWIIIAVPMAIARSAVRSKLDSCRFFATHIHMEWPGMVIWIFNWYCACPTKELCTF